MTINNINLIKPFLIWEAPNDFYFVQILKRKKENIDKANRAEANVKDVAVKAIENASKIRMISAKPEKEE